MFRGRLMKLRFAPEGGIEVVVFGLVTVYEKRGNYQIVCEEMHPKGMGALQMAFEKLKRKLEEEGLFDEEHKKPLPLLPRRIGVVTSPTGAAFRDILNVIERRFANVHILLAPSRVQGEEAAEEIVEGIRMLEEWGVDVMIVGRGGGSLEDLWPFNEEIVVRAVFAANTPVISAVGHEIDFTLTDFVADVRAPTPSAAAELVVREREALVGRVRDLRRALAKTLAFQAAQARNRLTLACSSFVFSRPGELVRQQRQTVDDLRMRLHARMAEHADALRRRLDHGTRALALLSPRNKLQRTGEQLVAVRRRLAHAANGVVARMRGRFEPAAAQLEALSPLAVLARGYALVWKQPEAQLVREASQLASQDRLLLRFGKGSATAAVDTVEDESDGGTEV